MEFLGFLAGAVMALLVAVALFRTVDPARRRRRRRDAAPPGEALGERDRVEALCGALSGDPQRDRPLLNRLLALGPSIVPSLLEHLAELLRTPDGPPPRRVARIEELVSDFGLAAVPPVTDLLARLQPTAPLAPALTRILFRLGQSGARSVMQRGLRHPELAAFLPRFRHLRRGDGATALFLTLRDAPGPAGDHLATLAGLLADAPEVLDKLWDAWDAPRRVGLLCFLADWLPLARPVDVRRGAADPHPQVQRAAARLAHLLVDPALVGPLSALARAGDAATRQVAVQALAAQPSLGARPALLEAAADADADVALQALIGCVRAHPAVADDALAAARALRGTPAHAMLVEQAPLDGPPGGPLEPLFAALDGGEDALRGLAAALLARHIEADPRARERLIRVADGSLGGDRVLAVATLARAHDPTAAELLVKCLRAPVDADARLHLQEAAQHIGEAALAPLARRLRPQAPGQVEGALAVLRAQPYAAAAPQLLRGLEDARSGYLEGLLAATLKVGGDAVRAVIDEALVDPRRGLLAPALRYLAAYACPADVDLLLTLFDRHLPLRSIILNLVEGQGEAARPALAQRIAAGGEDAIVTALEQRKALLDACAEGG
ncbi:MAG: hypothetical protein H6704_26220 [Myxococcales bacterium]|nr:hypothetical protein [Myxococcales bacterium]